MIASHEIQHTWRIKSVNTPLTLELRAIKDKRIIVNHFYQKDYMFGDNYPVRSATTILTG